MKKQAMAVLAAVSMLSSLAAGLPAAKVEAGYNFQYDLSTRYATSDIEERTEVRWWMAEGGHTDETLEEEVQAMYDAGFRGVELCQLSLNNLDATTYGYGSEQWNHDFHVVLNKALDLGMTVGITSGTNWNTTNVPGLDPDSQQAMQAVFQVHEFVASGTSRTGAVPTSYDEEGSSGTTTHALREVSQFIGAYAYKVVNNEASPIVLDGEAIMNLTDKVVTAEDGTMTLDFAAEDGDYLVFYYWMEATAQESSPATKPSYCVNYFDIRGFEAYKEYFDANVLNDPELNEKIKKGDVQLFMDSLEFSPGDGFTYWTESFAEEFEARKGYDVRPYLLLAINLPNLSTWTNPWYGDYLLADSDLSHQILNDLFDVQTQLYEENYLVPMKEYVNEHGISLRAQISYGRWIEISQPSMYVDYPEAENLNQHNQVDIYRLWSGAAKLENKILSSETGALAGMGYAFDQQLHLQEAYSLYADGFSRINWHVWSATYAPESLNADWPGFQNRIFGLNFHTLGWRSPDYADYAQMNQHLGRVQEFLREGVSRTDIGMPFIKYDQVMPTSTPADQDMWMQRHDTMLFPSAELQENGYTYDYFNPGLLQSEAVSYNAETGTLELAGYKALVLWQDWLSVEGAKDILALAKEGMKMVVVDGAAASSPFKADDAEELAAVMAELKGLENVKTAATADDVKEALDELGVVPYAGFAEENEQLLTQVRKDAMGNEFLYVYNYCDGSLHDGDDEDHGLTANVEIEMEGTFIPYVIDSWTGEVTKAAVYRHEDGKTIVPVELFYGDIALYAFEKKDTEELHAVSADADVLFKDEAIAFRAPESGTYTIALSDGNSYTHTLNVPYAYEIVNWDVTVESWEKGEQVSRTDTFTDSNGVTSVETAYTTKKTPISFTLDRLATWDNIPEVGKGVSGTAEYKATFNWDGNGSGAYIDFGILVGGIDVKVNGEAYEVNPNRAIIDVTNLVEGENTIEIQYNSNLLNELIETGIVREAGMKRGELWGGYNATYRSYGPAKATVRPYIQMDVTAEDPELQEYAQPENAPSEVEQLTFPALVVSQYQE